jgi:hypothetical protein
MRVLLSVLLLATVATAEPPVVTLPKEVTGEVSAFVVVKATVVGAKAVKYLPLDDGLSVFPSGLLSDPTVTVVVASKAGRYRVLAYSGNADGPSEPTTTTLVIGGAVAPPPKEKDPDPPVTPILTAKFLVVVRPAGPINPATEKLLNLPAWKELTEAGHQMRDFPVDRLPPGVVVPAGTTLPCVLRFKINQDKTVSPDGTPTPLPSTDDGIRGLVK